MKTEHATQGLARLETPYFSQLLSGCIHCGLCLPACPTYAVHQTEMAGPRGRITLMQAAADGRVELDAPAFQHHIEQCLGCRVCETACPSGVQYGTLLETTRAAIEETRTPSKQERQLRRVLLHQLLPHPQRLRRLARLLQTTQKLSLPQLTSKFKFVPPLLRRMAALLPPLTSQPLDYRQPASAIGARQGKVAFLHGCVQDAFLANVNQATVRVLRQNGYEVHFPTTQTCCGAAALHVGEAELARDLARRNIDAFAQNGESEAYTAIINNAGGCGATLKEYAHLLMDDPAYAQKADAFAAKVQDINEFLAVNLHAQPTKAINARVTYVDSCHLRHGQKVVAQPRALLQQIPGLELVELARPDQCCGSAGVYNLLQPETADQVLDAKMADVAATKANIIVTTNTGCHMQLLYGVKEAGLNAEVVHLVELMDRAYH